MMKYIRCKRQVLRDLGISQDVIDSIPWSSFSTEIQVDNYCRVIIEKWL